jgi:predicted metal-dependent hydrolase
VGERELRAPGEKTRRPRDELGQLLPWDAENRLRLEDFDSLPLEENHRLGIEHFNAGRFFPAHEAWETAWKQARGTGDEEFYKGLSQLGAGYTHFRRGNPHGAHTLMRRALSRIERYPLDHGGIDVRGLAGEVDRHAAAVEAAERSGDPLPAVEPPMIEPAG